MPATYLAVCSRVGMVRYPADGGSVFRSLVTDIRSESSGAAPGSSVLGVPVEFLDRAVASPR
ncbi:hypothetical protein QSJ19_12845 [Gordonia sp. ABSL11-1]|uniref:hypothetical protein n=1 Tax=Gordonia sp. ABSL11-1 TaxID=3053924 RepID=UPI002573D099|nr:hypothetical protein [Gordonia sp. ABSL11-1]MDL9946465.1 hypothetical protein [Gordonia sp. ABSL11-1]